MEYNEYVFHSKEQIIKDRLLKILNELSLLSDKELEIFLWGMGGQPRNFYVNLPEYSSINLVWHDTVMKGFFRFLQKCIPSESGLLKIKNLVIPEVIELFEMIGEGSLVGLYVFKDKAIADLFVKK